MNISRQARAFYFYPRSPCGERPTTIITICTALKFLSTLSLRRATTRRASRQQPAGISIHALLAESDPSIFLYLTFHQHFYPRSPCGERPPLTSRAKTILAISIHALLAESDLAGPSGPAFLYNFYPRSPCGERRLFLIGLHLFNSNFYPRSPCGERPCVS